MGLASELGLEIESGLGLLVRGRVGVTVWAKPSFLRLGLRVKVGFRVWARVSVGCVVRVGAGVKAGPGLE